MSARGRAEGAGAGAVDSWLLGNDKLCIWWYPF